MLEYFISIAADFDALAETLSKMKSLEAAGSLVAIRLDAAEAAARRAKLLVAQHIDRMNGSTGTP